MFLLAATVEITFLGHRCTSAGCGGTLECDGYEQCMMRGNATVTFGLGVLYEHADRVADCAEKWHRFWRQTLQKYRGCVSLGFSERSMLHHRIASPSLWLHSAILHYLWCVFKGF